MHEADQPQNTIKTLGRDATAQIGEGPSKGELIRAGLKKLIAKEHPDLESASIDSHAFGALSFICASLTHQEKSKREWGKNEIRELVKLGKER